MKLTHLKLAWPLCAALAGNALAVTTADSASKSPVSTAVATPAAPKPVAGAASAGKEAAPRETPRGAADTAKPKK